MNDSGVNFGNLYTTMVSTPVQRAPPAVTAVHSRKIISAVSLSSSHGVTMTQSGLTSSVSEPPLHTFISSGFGYAGSIGSRSKNGSVQYTAVSSVFRIIQPLGFSDRKRT